MCKRLYKMMEAFAETGHEVHYVALEELPIKSEKIKAHLLRSPFKKEKSLAFWMFFALKGAASILSIARRQGIQLITVFGSFYSLISVPASVVMGIPLITFIRADATEIDKILGRPAFARFMQDAAAFLSLRLSSKVIAVSETLKKRLILKYRLKGAEVLPNNIEENVAGNGKRENRRSAARSEMGAKETTFIISTSGVLDRRKNIGFLLKSFSLVKNQGALLVIVGDGPAASTLEDMAITLGLKDRIIFTGWREDATHIVRGSDLFVFPSLHEGASNSILEALGAEVPVMASNIEENREILKYEELLFKQGDIEGLAKKIELCIHDKTFYGMIRELSLKRGREMKFDWKDRVRKICGLRLENERRPT